MLPGGTSEEVPQETPEDTLGNYQKELLKDTQKEVQEDFSDKFTQCPVRFSTKNSWKITIRNTTMESYPEEAFGEVRMSVISFVTFNSVN